MIHFVDALIQGLFQDPLKMSYNTDHSHQYWNVLKEMVLFKYSDELY